MRARFAAILGVILALLAASRSAVAHEFRPCLLDFRDAGGGRFEAVWRAPASASEVTVELPAHCRREVLAGDRWAIDCGGEGLAGRSIAVRGLGGDHPEALVRFVDRGGDVIGTTVLRADSPAAVVPASAFAAPGPWRARVAGYLGAGMEHVLRGPDYLLFVLALLLLVRRPGELLLTVTSFTVAHSVTLGLAAFHVVDVPPAPVEASIALSLVLLAVELARGPGSRPSLVRRRPWAAAFAFGLLHGLGFAGGLAGLGVPQGQIPLALAAFNLGVEAGQLAFVAAALAGIAAIRRAWPGRPLRLSRAPAYVIGPLAVSWCIERFLALLA